MAQDRSRLDCRVYSVAEPSYQGRVFDAEPVAPRDAAEFKAEQLAHRDAGVVEEGYDTKVKIAEALEAAARAVGGDPVERSDAAAIRAAEARAVGEGAAPIPCGVAKQAQAAADANAAAEREEDKVTIADVVAWSATAKLPTDKAVTEEDAAAVAGAEQGAGDGAAARIKPYGVGEALAAAARHNQEDVLVGKTILRITACLTWSAVES